MCIKWHLNKKPNQTRHFRLRSLYYLTSTLVSSVLLTCVDSGVLGRWIFFRLRSTGAAMDLSAYLGRGLRSTSAAISCQTCPLLPNLPKSPKVFPSQGSSHQTISSSDRLLNQPFGHSCFLKVFVFSWFLRSEKKIPLNQLHCQSGKMFMNYFRGWNLWSVFIEVRMGVS